MTAPASVSTTPVRRRRAAEVAILVIVLVAGVFWTRNVPSASDLDPWDESSAMARGLRIDDAGFPPAQDSPLYAAWYRVLAPFAEDRVALYYLSHRATVVLLPLAVAGFLLASGTAWSLALVVPLVLLLGPLNLETWPRVGHFAAALVLLGSALVLRLENRRSRLLVGFGVAFALAFVRPELFLGCLLVAGTVVAVAWRAVDNRSAGARRCGRAGLVLALATLAGLGLPAFFGTGERQLVAFGQHYAVYTAENLGSLPPWTRWREVVARDFGAVEGLTEVVRADPAAFASHLTGNALRFPSALLEVVGRLVTPVASRWAGALLLVLATVVFLRRPREPSPIPASRWREAGLGVLLLLLPLGASCLLVYPRDHYLLVLAVPGLVITVARSLPLGTRGAGAMATALAALALVGAGLAARSTEPPVDRYRLRMVQALEAVDDGRSLVIVEAEGADGGFCKFLDSPCRRLGPELGAWRPSDLLDPESRVDAVVVSAAMERYPEIVADPTWEVLRSDPARLGFRRSSVHAEVLLRVGFPAAGGGATEEPPISPPSGELPPPA